MNGIGWSKLCSEGYGGSSTDHSLKPRDPHDHYSIMPQLYSVRSTSGRFSLYFLLFGRVGLLYGLQRLGIWYLLATTCDKCIFLSWKFGHTSDRSIFEIYFPRGSAGGREARVRSYEGFCILETSQFSRFFAFSFKVDSYPMVIPEQADVVNNQLFNCSGRASLNLPLQWHEILEWGMDFL